MNPSLHEWLADRAEGVPTPLLTAIQEAIDAAGGHADDPGQALRAAADGLLRRAVEGGQDDALALLTADALITYMCEIVSERDPGALARLS